MGLLRQLLISTPISSQLSFRLFTRFNNLNLRMNTYTLCHYVVLFVNYTIKLKATGLLRGFGYSVFPFFKPPFFPFDCTKFTELILANGRNRRSRFLFSSMIRMKARLVLQTSLLSPFKCKLVGLRITQITHQKQ